MRRFKQIFCRNLTCAQHAMCVYTTSTVSNTLTSLAIIYAVSTGNLNILGMKPCSVLQPVVEFVCFVCVIGID